MTADSNVAGSTGTVAPGREGRPAVLLIDDDEAFGGTLANALRRRRLEVDVATSAQAARACIACRAFDAVLLDLMLGDHASLDLLPHLRGALPAARIVMVTGYASIPTTVRAIKLGADDYLAKPVGVHEVMTALRLDEAVPVGPFATRHEGPVDASPLRLDQLEWEHIQRVLTEAAGNISVAAARLGMHRRTLQRKLQKRPSPGARPEIGPIGTGSG